MLVLCGPVKTSLARRKCNGDDRGGGFLILKECTKKIRSIRDLPFGFVRTQSASPRPCFLFKERGLGGVYLREAIESRVQEMAMVSELKGLR